jgi:hypothetical protein
VLGNDGGQVLPVRQVVTLLHLPVSSKTRNLIHTPTSAISIYHSPAERQENDKPQTALALISCG